MDSIILLNDWTDFDAVQAFYPLGHEKEFTKGLFLVVVLHMQADSSHMISTATGPRGKSKQTQKNVHIYEVYIEKTNV